MQIRADNLDRSAQALGERPIVADLESHAADLARAHGATPAEALAAPASAGAGTGPLPRLPALDARPYQPGPWLGEMRRPILSLALVGEFLLEGGKRR
jgi:hypothetical protein